MIGGVVPEGLVKRLDTMVGWEPPDSPRAIALKEAADVLRNLPTLQTDSKRLDDEAFAVKSYSVETCAEAKEMRLTFFGEHGQRRVLGHLTMDTPESYEFAGVVLKNYDKLEGIK